MDRRETDETLEEFREKLARANAPTHTQTHKCSRACARTHRFAGPQACIRASCRHGTRCLSTCMSRIPRTAHVQHRARTARSAHHTQRALRISSRFSRSGDLGEVSMQKPKRRLKYSRLERGGGSDRETGEGARTVSRGEGGRGEGVECLRRSASRGMYATASALQGTGSGRVR